MCAVDDLAQSFGDQIDSEWIALAARLPESTPDAIIEHLRIAYLESIRDDGATAVFRIVETWVNGRVVKITATVHPHVSAAFIWLAATLAQEAHARARTMRRLSVFVEDVPGMVRQ
jgi:hypothetical protein